jgi:MFS transporter, SHS family, sialic acid transporter
LTDAAANAPPLTTSGRFLILAVAFLGWLFAGVHMSITQLTGQPAAIDLLDRAGELDGARLQMLMEQAPTQDKEKLLSSADRAELQRGKPLVARWFAWFQCAFLFGAAAGGLCFGWLGDKIGRSKAMAASILTYSVLSAASALAQATAQLWVLWFLACTGVGGLWPNGVALVAEACSSLSRPVLAGVIGTAANIGIFLFATLASQGPFLITPEHWRWAFQVGAAPVALGILAWFAVPESPRWLAARLAPSGGLTAAPGVFRPALLGVTLIAILLTTIPMIGGWGTANWMIPWAETAGKAAQVGQARALTGSAGSLLGGWIASRVGRRPTYFLVSLASLGIAQYIFWFLVPADDWFLVWVAALGFVSGIYFGWLPLCLPELFPTRVRSTGAGIGFNFGRIVTAMTIFATGALSELFRGDYAQIGRITSLLFLLGMVGIWLAPDTSAKQLED